MVTLKDRLRFYDPEEYSRWYKMEDKEDKKNVDEGCGVDCFWDGNKYIKCGQKTSYGTEIYCTACKLKAIGVVVGAKFYEYTYCFNRVFHEHEVIKLNKSSVRIKTTFLEGSDQEPQVYAVENEKAFERFINYSVSIDNAIKNSIDLNKKEIKRLEELQNDIPKSIKVRENEIAELESKLSKNRQI